jgi:two-component system, chemotaxis family, CheB/CheR fusion protein
MLKKSMTVNKPSQGPRTPAQLETAPREAPRFFRDPGAFVALAQTVIPQLFVDKGANDHVRICVSGCATGEEAYSLAILLREHMDTLDVVPHVRVFATDIDQQALTIARRGTYPMAIADQMSPERLTRFFVKQDHTYRVQKALRELCLFALHRLSKDPPFTRMDLLSCQYMLMSLAPELQQKLMRLFHYALRPGGYLFLGTSEHLTEQNNLFRALDQQHRILQKIGSVSPVLIDFPCTNVGWPPPGPGEEAAHPRTAMPRQAEDVHKRALEDELELTQERLYFTIAELETLNEELSSAKEEFQSTNEELEASQAEFQAVNEELGIARAQ